MSERKWTLRIVDAKARIRAWSKRKTIYAILVAGLAAAALAPTAALADEVATDQPSSDVAVATVQAEPAAQVASAATQPAVTASTETTPQQTTAQPTEQPTTATDQAAETPKETVVPSDTPVVTPAPSEETPAKTADTSEATQPDGASKSDVAIADSTSGASQSADTSEKNTSFSASNTTSDEANAKATDISVTRTDDNYTQGTDTKLSMTEEREFRVTVGVDGVDQATLQGMLDKNEVTFWLKRDKGEFDSKEYPYQYMGGKLSDWKTVAAQDKRKGVDAPSIDFFKNVKAHADVINGKSAIVLDFGNNLLFGVNGIDVRARALVRSAMYDYVGAYQLICDLGNGSTVGTTLELRPYDEFHTQEEIDAALPKLEEQARENGIYAKVVTFGKSAEGRDMRAIFVADSEQDLKDYQALKKRMEKDPASVLAELHAGTLKYKVPVFYSNVHADEVVAVDAVMQFLKDLVACEPIDYTRLTGLTDEGKAELKTEMDADGTVWSDLIKDKVTGVGYIRGNGGAGNGVSLNDSRSNSGLNDASSDLSDEDMSKYYTMVTHTFDPKEILKHVFFILVPSENVDARTDNVRTNGNGFDLNRDNTYQTQPETQAMSGLISQWDPISLHEVHGYYQQFQIEPCSPTHDPNNEYDLFIDTALEEGEYFASTAVANTKTINSAQIPMRDYLKRQKDGSVAWDYPFDDMSTSYTPQYAMMHGTNAFTVEVPVGTSDAVHALEHGFIGNAQFVIDNMGRMFNNLLERYLRGVKNVDADTIRPYYVNQSDKAGAEAATFRPRDAKDVNGNTNDNFFPEYYVIPMGAETQEDRAAAIETIKFLLHNDVRVSRLTRDVTVGKKTYKAGTIVVDMHQAKRNMANCALYPNLVIDDWTPWSLYSEPVTNFSTFRGYDMDTIRTAGAFSGALEDITEAPDAKTAIHNKGPVSIIRNDSIETVRAINDLLRQGVKVGLITSGDHEGDYVIASSDLGKVSDKYILYVTQGKATPKAKLLRNDIKVYVPKAYGDFIKDADGNPHGLKGYYNRLNTNGNWDIFALYHQMGFTLTDNLDEATIVVGSQYPANADAVAAKIKDGLPYVGYTSDATYFLTGEDLINKDDFEWQESTGGFDALDTVTFPEDDIVTATYRIEGDYIMYGYGGSYFVRVPKNAKVLIRTTDDRPIEGFMTKDFIEKYKGKIQAIKLVDGKENIVLFANTLTNKAHQQDDYRYLTASIYSMQMGDDFPTIAVPAEENNEQPEKKPQTSPAESAEAVKGATLFVPATNTPKHAALAKSGSAALPKTGDDSANPTGIAVLAGGVLAAGALVRGRRRED
jgi:LPXTG-motif cell wall-anchored protein